MEKLRNRIISPEIGPDKLNRLKYLLECFEMGLNNPNIVGYHGTSLETIMQLVEVGKIKGGYGGHLSAEMASGRPRQVSIFLNGTETTKVHDVYGYLNEPALRSAVGYANMIGKNHALLEFLGLDIDNYSHLYLDTVLQDDLINRKIINRRTLTIAHKKAAKRNGVVLGVSKKIFEDFQIRQTRPYDEKGEIVLVTPEGVGIEYFLGIEPVGQYEWDYFAKLQTKLSKGKYEQKN